MKSRAFPVDELASQFSDAIREGVTRWIVSAPTGSGKSTQIPQLILDSPGFDRGKSVYVLQPRRLAARMLSSWVAGQRGQAVGDEVGYQVRFERRVGRATRLHYVTEGIILRKLLQDPSLSSIGCVILDEFHERHLYTDLTLGRLVALQQERRPDLLLVVMSATLEMEELTRFLPGSRKFESQGRRFPVEIDYASAAECDLRVPVWERVQQALRKRLPQRPEGDVLIFLPGAHEIRRTIQLLQSTPECRQMEILPLYGDLSPEAQDLAVAGPGARRKIIVATNVAETSLTIDGVRWVLDSGLARIPEYDPRRGMDTLIIQPISQFSAEQRAGRAGRTGPGHCTRLWTLATHERRPAATAPEVRRLDLAETVLFLKVSGFGDLSEFPWITPPQEGRLEQAISLLTDLGALSANGGLTEMGRKMSDFPVHPRFSRIFHYGSDHGCLPELAVAAALLQERSILLRGGNRDDGSDRERESHFLDEATAESDLLYQIRIWNWARATGYDPDRCDPLGIHRQACRRVEQVARQFLGVAESAGMVVEGGVATPAQIREGIALGFADQIALRTDRGTRRCKLVHGRTGELRRESVVDRQGLLVAADLEEVSHGGQVKTLLGMVSTVEESWLNQHFPDDFRDETVTTWDDSGRRITGVRRTVFRDLVIRQEETEEVDEDVAASLLAQGVADGRLRIKRWDAAVERWIARLNFLAHWDGESGFNRIGVEEQGTILQLLCHGCRRSREVLELDPWSVLRGWIPAGMESWMDAQAPEEMEFPTRKRPIRLRYEAPDQPPVLAAMIQELYDVTPERLVVLGGKLPLRLELLAPNRRPVQIIRADQLAEFWTRSYPEIRKELRGRYPKHEWR